MRTWVRVLTLVFVAVGLALTAAVSLNTGSNEAERTYFLNRKWSIASSDLYPLIILHWQTVNTIDVSIWLEDWELYAIALLPTGVMTWRYWWRGIIRRKYLTLRRILNYAPPLALALYADFTFSYWPLDFRAPGCWLIAALLVRAAILVIWPPKEPQRGDGL